MWCPRQFAVELNGLEYRLNGHVNQLLIKALAKKVLESLSFTIFERNHEVIAVNPKFRNGIFQITFIGGHLLAPYVLEKLLDDLEGVFKSESTGFEIQKHSYLSAYEVNVEIAFQADLETQYSSDRWALLKYTDGLPRELNLEVLKVISKAFRFLSRQNYRRFIEYKNLAMTAHKAFHFMKSISIADYLEQTRLPFQFEAVEVDREFECVKATFRVLYPLKPSEVRVHADQLKGFLNWAVFDRNPPLTIIDELDLKTSLQAGEEGQAPYYLVDRVSMVFRPYRYQRRLQELRLFVLEML